LPPLLFRSCARGNARDTNGASGKRWAICNWCILFVFTSTHLSDTNLELRESNFIVQEHEGEAEEPLPGQPERFDPGGAQDERFLQHTTIKQRGGYTGGRDVLDSARRLVCGAVPTVRGRVWAAVRAAGRAAGPDTPAQQGALGP
jgi:hypothetical protein